MSAWIAPVVGSAVNAATSIIGQNKANKANRDLARKQREWNEAMWHKQNAYNAPIAQMARLKSAGLNPRMIYGAGASTAVGTAGDVKGYDRAEAESVTKGLDAFGQMYNFRNIQAQTDNVEAQTQVAKQDAAVKSIKALREAVGLKSDKFSYELRSELRDSTIQTAKANMDKALSEASVMASKAKVDSQSIQNRVNKIAFETSGQKFLNQIRAYDVELQKEGIQRSDNIILRMLLRHPKGKQKLKQLIDSGIDIMDIFKTGKNKNGHFFDINPLKFW